MNITPKFYRSIYRVLDAGMGAGKSTAIISYINSTLHLVIILVERQSEVDRYVKACPRLISVADVAELSGTLKSEEIINLVKQGKSIVSTHQLFARWDGELLREIKQKGYELIKDEVIEGFEVLRQFKSEDFQLMLERKQLEAVPNDKLNRVRLGLFPLPSRYQDVTDALKNRDCYLYEFAEGIRLITAPKEEAFRVFDKVTILTYMFQASTLSYMFKMNGYNFDYFSVKDGHIVKYYKQNGERFLHQLTVEGLARRALRLSDGRPISLSSSEATNKPAVHGVICKEIRNVYRRWQRDAGISSNDFAYTYHGDYWEEVHHRDHSNLTLNRHYRDIVRREQMTEEQRKAVTFIPQTTRGTNDHSHKKYMVFAVNVHMNPIIENFLKSHFETIDTDSYALSRLVQWLWRGCIRKGEPMVCCVFSKRMRNLLNEWLGLPTER